MPFNPNSGIDRLSFLAHKDMYPGSQIDKTQYSVSSQYPTSAQTVVAGYDPRVNPLTGEQTQHMANGGIVALASGGEIASAYRQYLGRDPEDGAYSAWADADINSLISGIMGSDEYNQRQSSGGGGGGGGSNPTPVQTGSGQGGGGDIDALFRQYLGRSPDDGARQTFAGWGPDQIRQAILDSPEYAGRQPSGGGGGGGPAPSGGGDINSLFQQYLGRTPDDGARQTFAGMGPDQIRQAILGSPEYAQLHPEAAKSNAAEGGGQNPQDLAQEVFNLYRTNQNYDRQISALGALPQDADYYKARIGLIGQMMGWQIGQGTPERNSSLQEELNSYVDRAKALGVKTTEMSDLLKSNAQAQAKVNAERIASDAKGAHGFIDQNLGKGATSFLTTAAAMAANYFLPGSGMLVKPAASLLNQDDDNYTAPRTLSPTAKTPTTTDAPTTTQRSTTSRTTTPTFSRTTTPTAVRSFMPTTTQTYNPLTSANTSTGTGTSTTNSALGTGTDIGTATGIASLGAAANSQKTLAGDTPAVDEVPLFKLGTPSALAGSQSVAQQVAAAQQATAAQQVAALQQQTQVYEPDYEDFVRGGIARLAGGGNLGGYSDGGRLLKGPGDGMSDNIPAMIGAKQPARLADGEFVIPADVVSHLGNGSTDAGAKNLYNMMNKIRKARTGNPKQGRQINAAKFLPRG